MKFTVSTALKRAGAGLTLGAALLAVSGCGYIYTQPTTLHYAASDGVHSTINGNIELRNIRVVSHGKGAEGRVLGTVLNKGNNDATVTFNFPSGAKTVNVPKGQQVRLEQDDHKLVIPQVAPQPGETLSNTRVSVGDASGTLNIPVMDGTLKEYKPTRITRCHQRAHPRGDRRNQPGTHPEPGPGGDGRTHRCGAVRLKRLTPALEQVQRPVIEKHLKQNNGGCPPAGFCILQLRHSPFTVWYHWGYASNLYPSPRTVTTYRGEEACGSMLERRRLICTSRVFVSPT